jgi:hypothetical protein
MRLAIAAAGRSIPDLPIKGVIFLGHQAKLIEAIVKASAEIIDTGE